MDPERNMESTTLSLDLLPNGNIFVAYNNINNDINISIYDQGGRNLIERKTINLIGNIQRDFLTPLIAKKTIYLLSQDDFAINSLVEFHSFDFNLNNLIKSSEQHDANINLSM